VHIQYTVDTLPQFNLVQRLRCPVACRPISADVMLSDRACLNSNPLAGGAWALRGLTSDFIRLSCYWSNLVPREDPGNEVVIDHEFYFLIRLDPLGDNIFYDKCRTFSLLSNYPPLKAYRHINFNLCDASTTWSEDEKISYPNWRQNLMRLGCNWQIFSSQHCQGCLRVQTAISSWIHSFFDDDEIHY